MKILSIETSCDDTAITILETKKTTKYASFRVLANVSNSQIKIHAPYGGVYPMLAKREHIKNLPILLEQIFKNEGPTFYKKIGAIAVTYGPGLEPALWSGITFAKKLAKKWNIPLIPVNHMEGHIVSVFGKHEGKFTVPLPSAKNSKQTKIDLPILSLLVSGGHTELVLSKKWMQYKIIGETLDDAVGEAYDKVARMLGLKYPGGPKISKLAEKARVLQDLGFTFPRPILHSKNFDFSFSGLKTSILYLIKKIGNLDKKTKSQIALGFENAAIECLVYKTVKAIEKYKAKTVIVAGGVACNEHLRREMKNNIDKNTKLLFPEKNLTMDNSIMIGIAGYLQFVINKKKFSKATKIKALGNLRFK